MNCVQEIIFDWSWNLHLFEIIGIVVGCFTAVFVGCIFIHICHGGYEKGGNI